MARGALSVTRELGKDALLVELVAERAVRTESRGRINAGLLVDMQMVRELKQDGPRRFVPRKLHEV